jgi:AAA15 family ATPase/GTPase
MIESIRVENFRCYQKLELEKLRRINVIVGKNASGKTALLESIFIAGGNSPEIAIRVDSLRGLGSKIQIKLVRSAYESLWRDLFFGFDQNKNISIHLMGSPTNTRSVNISYSRGESFTLPISEVVNVDSPLIVPIVFEWSDLNRVASRSEVRVTPEGLVLGGGGEALPLSFFSSATQSNPTENADRFSDLSKRGKGEAVIEGLRKEFPYVDDVSIQMRASTAMLYASIKNIPEKMPLGLVSSGINKLVSLMLGIADKPQGIVLVDEIENGFYHDTLPTIWSTLWRLCKGYNAQLFASTHSQECLKALLPAINQNEEDFLLIRTYKENGRCLAETFSGRKLESAILQNIDVR